MEEGSKNGFDLTHQHVTCINLDYCHVKKAGKKLQQKVDKGNIYLTEEMEVDVAQVAERRCSQRSRRSCGVFRSALNTSGSASGSAFVSACSVTAMFAAGTLQSMFRQLMASCSGSCSLQRVGCSPLGPPLVSETSLPSLCRCRLGLLRSGPPISFYCAYSGCCSLYLALFIHRP